MKTRHAAPSGEHARRRFLSLAAGTAAVPAAPRGAWMLFTMIACLCAVANCFAGEPTKQIIPDFAPDSRTGWVLDRSFGVDDLLPPPTGGPGPVTFGHLEQ